MKSEYRWIIFKIRALLQRDSWHYIMACVTSQVVQNVLLTYYLFCPREGDNPACYLCWINTSGKHNTRYLVLGERIDTNETKTNDALGNRQRMDHPGRMISALYQRVLAFIPFIIYHRRSSGASWSPRQAMS